MRSRKLAVLGGLGVAAIMTSIGLGIVGVANAENVSATQPSVATAAGDKTAAKDAAPEDNAHWSANQRLAVQIAAQALDAKVGGATKVLSSEFSGKDGIYITRFVTPAKGSFTVTVDVAAKTVISIKNA